MEKLELNISGYEVMQKRPKLTGKKSTSCTIYVPKEWSGKNVTIILNEKLESSNE